jgi:hypothetical protein
MDCADIDAPMKVKAERILAKAREHNISVGRVVSSAAIDHFEKQNGVELPSEYKAFLLHIGNGSEGPYDSSLLYFYDPQREVQPRTARVRLNSDRVQLPFPFSDLWIWEADASSPQGTFDDVENGNICVAEGGCGMEWRLILTGPERGNLWFFSDVGICPTLPRRDFLTWYEAWLDGERWRPDAE